MPSWRPQFDPITGQPLPGTGTAGGDGTGPAGAIAGFYNDPLGSIREGTDALGITVPDPSKSPEYQKLVEAANTFSGNYNAAGAGVGETRGLDLQTIKMLQEAAAGRAPSAAQNLMRSALDENANRSLGLASTIGGRNPGMALRSGLTAFQQTGQNSAADFAALRAKEQEAARALLAQSTGAAAGRDVQRELGAGNLYAGAVGAPFGAQERAGAANQALLGTIWGAVAKSDERSKANIGAGGPMSDEFLSSLIPKTFDYKQQGPNQPSGQRLGVMAQDLPKHNVMTGPDGQKWISATAISDMLAGMGRLHQRLEAVEGGGKRQPPGTAEMIAGSGGRATQAGTVAGGAGDYGAAMDYVTAPRSDARTLARAASGQAPDPRMQVDEEPMIPDSQMREFLMLLGLAR